MKYKNLSAYELRKRPWRADLILEKLEGESAFLLCDGSTKVLTCQDTSALVSLEVRDLQNLRFESCDVEYSIKDIAKNDEFGGRGIGASTRREDRTLSFLRDQLFCSMKEHKSSCLPITVGHQEYKVDDIVTTPGTPKSDFHFTLEGEPVLWISHKAGMKPSDFQTWGGISESREPKIAAHPETQEFVADLKSLYPDGLKPAMSLCRSIECQNLQFMSVYGAGYGGEYSEHNVQVVAQGKMNIVDGVLTSTNIHFNGEKLDYEYTPVLSAIYKSDRSDYRIKNARMSTHPRTGRKFKEI